MISISFLVEMILNVVSLVVASAMLLLVLWQSSRRRENRLVALYMATIVAWSGANQAAHFWKNIALTGATLMIYYFATVHPEAWPYSLGR